MSVRKRKLKGGAYSWGYVFEAPGSSRKNRKQPKKFGFATKGEAVEAEAAERIRVRAEYEAALEAASRPPEPAPQTLRQLLLSYFEKHSDRNLQPKTAERYRQCVDYLSNELLDTSVPMITPHVLTREWVRLVESGGHHRRTKECRPLSPKSVRNIAGVLSSAFKWACGLGQAPDNPVKNSTLPRVERRRAFALTVEQTEMLQEACAHSEAALLMELCGASGARRGEVLALRWSDVRDGEMFVCQTLSQTKRGLFFKVTKTFSSTRGIALDASTMKVLESHRRKQEQFRKHFGPDYRRDLDLILANEDGTPLRPDSLSAKISALCRRLKLPKGVSLHTLRHTHASQLLSEGVELPVVSKRLGHANPAITAGIYAHVINGRDREAAEVWERLKKRHKQDKPSA